jgi:hypothetical protein
MNWKESPAIYLLSVATVSLYILKKVSYGQRRTGTYIAARGSFFSLGDRFSFDTSCEEGGTVSVAGR